MAQTLVTVSVLDINDNCPVFLGVPYYATVPVDSAKGDVITKACARFGKIKSSQIVFISYLYIRYIGNGDKSYI